ncbi:hypothetical protein [Puerhibacterium puerhi]|uniref:hypothetical protein n=1 Tax=Puerhibacterium puerhi TaxID=2692623 RepID=UPI00135A09FB|nr:hypothetical protein [Puerhibacterium puerhi]
MNALAIASTLILGVALAPPETDYSGWADNYTKEVFAGATGKASSDEASGGGQSSAASKDKYFRADAKTCAIGDLDMLVDIVTQAGTCAEGYAETVVPAPCEDGTYQLDALWVQRVQDDGSYAPAEQVSEDQCVTPGDIRAEAERAFRSMRVSAPPVTLQGGEPLLVNVRYPAYTTAAAQEQDVTLLGVPVTIRAEPVEFAWDFDDPHSPGGGTLVTSDPGRPWRDGDPTPDESWVGHTYTRLGEPGSDAGSAVDDAGNTYRSGVTVSLATTWEGSFRIAGSTDWTPIAGTITTTSAGEPATVTEARTQLVCDDLAGSATC